MDDRDVRKLRALELAYKKQLVFMAGLVSTLLIGIVVYITTLYRYDLGLLLIAIVLVVSSIVGIFTVDDHLKTISEKMRGKY